jgi:hypothetical protein
MSQNTNFEKVGDLCYCNQHTVVTRISNERLISQCSDCRLTVEYSVSNQKDRNIIEFRLFTLHNFMNENCTENVNRVNNNRIVLLIHDELSQFRVE